MSLTKLFNKNYAIQNIKKSKIVIILMLIIIPLVTLFSVHITGKSYYGNNIKVGEYVWPSIIGIAVIPLVLSIVLLGYVYKKNKVDFINSMPINRKTIFMTNIILGIAFILVLQLAILGVNGIYVLFHPNIGFLFQMMLDMMLVMTISYIYIFSICALAVTLSGNIMTQIVICLLLILLPYFLYGFNYMLKADNINTPALLISQDDVVNRFETREDVFYGNYKIMPISTFINLLSNEKVIDPIEIIVTIGLTIFNIGLGVVLFDKRKMENNGVSFESNKVHIFVKALTLIPFACLFTMFLISEASFENIAIMSFIVFIIFMYYLIYDLITSKKMKFKVSLLSFICIFTLLCGVTYLVNLSYEAVGNNMGDIRVDNSKVSSITIDSFNGYKRVKRNLQIVDKELCDFMLNHMINSEDYYQARTSVEYADDKFYSQYQDPIKLVIKLNNKDYILNVYFTRKDYEYIVSELKEMDESKVKYVGDLINTDNIFYSLNGRYEGKILPGKSIDKLKEEINKDIIDTSVKEIFEHKFTIDEEDIDVNLNSKYNSSLMITFYDSGKVYEYNLKTKDLSDELANDLINNSNKANIEELNKLAKKDKLYDLSIYRIVIDDYTNNEIYRSEFIENEDIRLVDYLYNNTSNIDITNDKVVDFILEDDTNHSRKYTIHAKIDDNFKKEFPKLYEDIIQNKEINSGYKDIDLEIFNNVNGKVLVEDTKAVEN